MAKPNRKRLRKRDAVILFADIVGSTGMAEERRTGRYVKVVNELKKVAEQARNRLEEWGYEEGPDFELTARGDEICLILHPVGEGNSQSRHADAASDVLLVALELKLSWLLSPYNRKRLKQRHMPRDLAIGIHRGRVLCGQHSRGSKKQSSEGFDISVAKRVESEARKGKSSRVFISDPMKRWLKKFCKKDAWDMPALDYYGPLEEARGLPPGRYHLYELKAVGDIPNRANTRLVPRVTDKDGFDDLCSMAFDYPKETWLCSLLAVESRERGHEARDDGQHKKAKGHYRKATKLLLDWWRPWWDWGQLYLRPDNRNPKKAIPKLRRACEVAPDAIVPRRALINALLSADREKDAVKAARLAFREVPCDQADLRKHRRCYRKDCEKVEL